jgi:N-acetylneuraminic acid mutarotase
MKTNNRYKKFKTSFVVIDLVTLIVLTWAGSTQAATWTQKADIPTPRKAHSTAAVDGKIYVIGGLATDTSYNNSGAIPAVEEYDPATDTWTRKADMPEARGYLDGSSLPVVDGKIYVMGGGNPASARVDIYNPATDTWSRGADMPTPRLIFARVAFEGKIYTFGGLAGLGNSDRGLKTTDVYDPKTDTWTESATMPQAVWGHSAEVVDGKIYVIGGSYGIDAMQIHQVYDPQTNTWTSATPMPIRTRGHATSVVCGKIYAIGGWLNSGQRPRSNTWMYDPTTDIWTETAPLPDVRAGFSASVVNGKIYAMGGTRTGHPTAPTSTVYELELDFPPPDYNGDGIIDGADISIMINYWHVDNPLYDIAPAPCGDGIVDVQDLVFLSEHLFEEVNDPTLVAHWALDEIEGDIAQDSAGDNFGFVNGSSVWQPSGGQVNGAIQLDGVDDYIIVSQILNPADSPFSILVWIKGGAAGNVIISEPGGSNWLSTDLLDGKLITGLVSPPVGRFITQPMESESIITDGQWHRIGFAWDGSYRHLYVDGVEVAGDTTPLSSLEEANNGLYLGAGSSLAPGTFFSGLIDDVRIYERVVTP